jgi:peptide/nickel transport system permease protein
MINYLIRRLVTMILVLFLSSVAIFFLLRMAPDSRRPGQNVCSRFNCPGKNEYEELIHSLGLDRPIYLSYITWLTGDDWIEALPVWFTGTDIYNTPFENGTQRGILRGDWGDSWGVSKGDKVLDVILSRLPNTLSLMIAATLVSLVIAIPIGITSAVKKYSTLDYASTTFSFVGISMPVFWMGLMMIILFSLKFKEWGLPYLPSGGVIALRGEGAGSLLDRIQHLIMPTLALSLLYMAGWSRFMRTSMLDVLHQDYVRTARAKGLVERLVILKHSVRNALIPLITVITLQLSALFGGAVLTESVFAYPGMGHLYLNAISRADWPVVQGYLIILAVIVVVSNLIADLAYGLVDPRIRYA